MLSIINSTQVPSFSPSSKVKIVIVSDFVTFFVASFQTIITDESVKKPESGALSMDAMETCHANLEVLAAAHTPQGSLECLYCPPVIELPHMHMHREIEVVSTNLRERR